MEMWLYAFIMLLVLMALKKPILLIGLIIMGVAIAFLGPLGFILGVIALILLLK